MAYRTERQITLQTAYEAAAAASVAQARLNDELARLMDAQERDDRRVQVKFDPGVSENGAAHLGGRYVRRRAA